MTKTCSRRPEFNIILCRVTDNEDLFTSENDDKLIPWNETKYLCSCEVKNEHAPVGSVACNAKTSKKCQDDRTKAAFSDRCSVSTRRKRSLGGKSFLKSVDLHFDTDIAFVSRIPSNKEDSMQVQMNNINFFIIALYKMLFRYTTVNIHSKYSY